MMSKFPALFVSHGAPSLILDESPARDFFRQLGHDLGRPKAIICVSAHWTTPVARVSSHPHPGMIYDFGGFSDELYKLTYPAPGDPRLARRLLTLLYDQSIDGKEDPGRGFDHGAWVPLMLMYPDADIPVVQLSVQPHLSPPHHLAMGKALQPLREEGVLIVASGSATHNLRDFFSRHIDAEPLPYARDFNEWLKEQVSAGRIDDLLEYSARAPHAHKNHPTPEHLLPLFVAMGAGEEGRVLHDSFNYGAISMAAFAWS
ncbi:MAG: dioxygenase [Deltaproteobacteria bacterium HGW-Deltaproteobacteria-4]|nr:MAG: dioxygenase [Deltaproteobacteria bacterium HGW-Deltaproteobacteria-4]